MKRLGVGAAMIASWLVAGTALALPPEIKIELDRQSMNVKIASQTYEHVVEEATRRMKQTNSVVPSRHDDARVLAAMRGMKASLEQMVSFYWVYEDALRPETRKFDADVAELQGSVSKMQEMVRAAEAQGEIESIANRRR
jgi:hypothetical protein